MKRKGFTLIELLAVIVILAIIALIATPAVLNIIEDSRKGAAEASARNIVSAAKTYYMSETMQGRTVGTIDLSGDTLKYDGDQANKGSIAFTDGKASGTIYISGYCVTVSIDGKVTSEKAEEDECEIIVTPSEPTTYTKYNNGTPLLYDPVNNAKCETSIGSATGTNDGCMKWYAFLDSEDSSTVNLILDHNTTDYVAWGSSSSVTTPDIVIEKLVDDITNWNASVKSTARLISAEEVHKIAPSQVMYDVYGSLKGQWSQTDTSNWYYFHTENQTRYEGAAGSNTFAWLFDNLYKCTIYGCNVGVSSDSYGYWTDTHALDHLSWFVNHVGSLSAIKLTTDDSYGVRPVITVSKSIFE